MWRFWKQVSRWWPWLGRWACGVLSVPGRTPRGGGGGLVNPAWVVNDTATLSTLRLLSFDGLKAQDIVKAKAFRGMYSPVWSPDGQWIAFAQGTGSGMSIRRVKPDGSNNQLV